MSTTTLPAASVRAARPGAVFLADLRRANPALFWTGALNAGLAVLALALLPLDHRVVTGLLVWWKPLKFALSLVAYAWTLAWMLAKLPAAAQRSVRVLSAGVAGSMGIEVAVVVVQAARGTTSHFNTSSAFDGALWALMGLFVIVNTLLTFWALYLVLRHRPQGPAALVLGLRLGLGLFIAGTLLAGFMLQLNQHTVGAPDGGPGLPGLGWSTRAGDLRTAHFLGMHALQAVPLWAAALRRWAPHRAVLLTGLGAAVYGGAVAALFAQALAGMPLWAGR